MHGAPHRNFFPGHVAYREVQPPPSQSSSASTKLVSAADKLHNARATLSDLRAFGPEVWTRVIASREDTLWYYGALVKAFRTDLGAGRIRDLVDELARTVEQLG